MTWAAYFIATTSGQVGPSAKATSGSWAIELNGTESGSLVVPKSQLRAVGREWFDPRAGGGVLLTYTHEGVERPIVAGPVLSWPTETAESLTISFAGIREVFERRTLDRDLRFDGPSLGAIGWELAVEGMNKPGGALPVVYAGRPEQSGRERTYEAWNLSNNWIGKRWSELSDVEAGPDIMLRPQWTDGTKTAIEWAFVHGTEADPGIPQEWVPDFDGTAARGNLAGLSVRTSGANLASRVWATGAGEGNGVARAYAQNLASVNAGAPFLEAVISEPDQEVESKLREKAAGVLALSQDVLVQITAEARADDRKAPAGTYHVGDLANVTLPDDLLTVPAGTRALRIVKASGDLGRTVTLDFQEDYFG